MSPKLGLALSILLLSSAPVLAQQSCGSIPFAPAMPSPDEMKTKALNDAESALHDAFTDIKNWQGDLKTYRACTDNASNQAKSQIAGLDQAKDADKIKQLKDQKAEADHLYNQSIDQEEKVVNQFHAAQAAYCMRSDANKSKCPK